MLNSKLITSTFEQVTAIVSVRPYRSHATQSRSEWTSLS
jgi:hypothetical protein